MTQRLNVFLFWIRGMTKLSVIPLSICYDYLDVLFSSLQIVTIGPVSGIWLIRIVPACFRTAGYGHSPVLKTALKVSFQKCATHRVVSVFSRCSKSSIVAEHSFCFICHFVNPLISVGRLIARWPETERGAGCSLFARSSPTVDAGNRVKRLQPNVNGPFSVSGPVSVSMRFTKWQININNNKHHYPSVSCTFLKTNV